MTIRTEYDGPVTTIVLDRPEARNAVSPERAQALLEAVTAFEADPNSRVAVLWGAGGVFCAGFDLKHAATLMGQDRPMAKLDFAAVPEGVRSSGPMGPTRLTLDKPILAAIAGPAVAGGMELALWCDMRVMEETAFMGVYCRRWGVPLIDGGTVRLPRIVGRGRALDLIMTGRKVEAEEALRIGLCERVVPHGQSRAAAEAIAHEIAKFPQECMRADRRSVWLQEGRDEEAAMRAEWANSIGTLAQEGAAGAARFSAGKGRGGDFSDI